MSLRRILWGIGGLVASVGCGGSGDASLDPPGDVGSAGTAGTSGTPETGGVGGTSGAGGASEFGGAAGMAAASGTSGEGGAAGTGGVGGTSGAAGTSGTGGIGGTGGGNGGAAGTSGTGGIGGTGGTAGSSGTGGIGGTGGTAGSSGTGGIGGTGGGACGEITAQGWLPLPFYGDLYALYTPSTGDPNVDRVYVEFIQPMGSEPLAVGTYDLSEPPNDNYGTCRYCVSVVVNGWMHLARSGLLVVDSIDPSDSSRSTGYMQDVELEKVTLDPVSRVSTPVPGGSCYHIDYAAWGEYPWCEEREVEPNDTESFADDQGSMDDCDSSATCYSGAMEDSQDVDWFTFYGEDAFLCAVDPTFTLHTPSGAGAEVCAYFDCELSSSPHVDCPGATPSISPSGGAGCCTTDGTLSTWLTCEGTTADFAQVSVRVSKPTGVSRFNYVIEYHY